jgi:hypothetical protein
MSQQTAPNKVNVALKRSIASEQPTKEIEQSYFLWTLFLLPLFVLAFSSVNLKKAHSKAKK